MFYVKPLGLVYYSGDVSLSASYLLASRLAVSHSPLPAESDAYRKTGHYCEGVSELSAATRGVLHPARLPTFHREPVTGELSVFVRWFWIPEWNIEPGRSSRQHLIGFPASNLVVEGDRAEISGPTTRAAHRDLTGRGWAVGALLRPAATPALVGDVTELRDSAREVDLPELTMAVAAAMSSGSPPADRAATTGDAASASDAEATDSARRSRAVAAFSSWLLEHLDKPSNEALLANRIIDAAETQHDILSIADLASFASVSTRTLQRLTAKYVGLSPAALIRRRRLQEAAERLREDPSYDLTTLAREFGYVDQAHLTNDFRHQLGFTPNKYRRALSAE